LSKDDYDFGVGGLEQAADIAQPRARVAEEFERFVAQVPTFAAVYKSGAHEAYYCPPNVIVLCAPGTFSSGYTLMHYLYRAGATAVGTPSSQSGNCFGDTIGFELEHSGLSGTVSHKRFEYFPEDSEKGRVLEPQYPLTYDKLAAYDFDRHAAILYALDIAAGRQ
jgi:hypothetical protein